VACLSPRQQAPLRQALELIRHQLAKENLWLEEQVMQLARQVDLLRARRLG
jgi:hypothetical protein